MDEPIRARAPSDPPSTDAANAVCAAGMHVFRIGRDRCECGAPRAEMIRDPRIDLLRRQVWFCAYLAESVMAKVSQCESSTRSWVSKAAADRALADFDERFEVQR